MMTERQKSRSTRMTLFAVALLIVPILLIAVYFYEQPSASRLDFMTDSENPMSELESMEQMWQHHPGHAPIALELGNLYFEARQYEKAITYYREYLKLDTSATGFEVRLDICRALHQLGNVAAATQELDTLLMKDPFHAGALYNYGAIEANAGNFDGAREHWNLLAQKHPADSLGVMAARSLKLIDSRTP